MYLRLFIFGILFITNTTHAKEPQTLTGIAHIVDGDSLRINGHKIRLAGIDAPEIRQQCTDNNNALLPCGQHAKSALAAMIANQPVTCEYKKKDRYGRLLGTCYVGNTNLNQLMVASGHALAYTRYSKRYARDQRRAQKQHKQIWQTSFVPPEQWRRHNKH